MGESEQETQEVNPDELTPDVELPPDEETVPDDELDDEPEPEPEPEQRVPADVTILAARDKALTSETRRHENALKRIYGDDFADFQPCPLCLTDGWVIPAPPGAIEDEQWQAILMAAGQDAPANYETAPYAEPCLTCNGKGMLRTGSVVPSQATVACRDCSGQGWREKIATQPYTPPSIVVTPGPNGEQPNYNQDGPKDSWGRPSGHPHYGIEPAYVS